MLDSEPICCWTAKGVPCGEPAKVRRCIPLCVAHERDSLGFSRSTILQAASVHGTEVFPGFCYFALLPSGDVKIGYANTIPLLKQRFRKLTVKYGQVFQLAVMPGGFVAEAVMHERFRDCRKPGLGELFTYTPAMAEFVSRVAPLAA